MEYVSLSDNHNVVTDAEHDTDIENHSVSTNVILKNVVGFSARKMETRLGKQLKIASELEHLPDVVFSEPEIEIDCDIKPALNFIHPFEIEKENIQTRLCLKPNVEIDLKRDNILQDVLTDKDPKIITSQLDIENLYGTAVCLAPQRSGISHQINEPNSLLKSQTQNLKHKKTEESSLKNGELTQEILSSTHEAMRPCVLKGYQETLRDLMYEATDLKVDGHRKTYHFYQKNCKKSVPSTSKADINRTVDKLQCRSRTTHAYNTRQKRKFSAPLTRQATGNSKPKMKSQLVSKQLNSRRQRQKKEIHYKNKTEKLRVTTAKGCKTKGMSLKNHQKTPLDSKVRESKVLKKKEQQTSIKTSQAIISNHRRGHANQLTNSLQGISRDAPYTALKQSLGSSTGSGSSELQNWLSSPAITPALPNKVNPRQDLAQKGANSSLPMSQILGQRMVFLTSCNNVPVPLLAWQPFVSPQCTPLSRTAKGQLQSCSYSMSLSSATATQHTTSSSISRVGPLQNLRLNTGHTTSLPILKDRLQNLAATKSPLCLSSQLSLEVSHEAQKSSYNSESHTNTSISVLAMRARHTDIISSNSSTQAMQTNTLTSALTIQAHSSNTIMSNIVSQAPRDITEISSTVTQVPKSQLIEPTRLTRPPSQPLSYAQMYMTFKVQSIHELSKFSFELTGNRLFVQPNLTETESPPFFVCNRNKLFSLVEHNLKSGKYIYIMLPITPYFTESILEELDKVCSVKEDVNFTSLIFRIMSSKVTSLNLEFGKPKMGGRDFHPLFRVKLYSPVLRAVTCRNFRPLECDIQNGIRSATGAQVTFPNKNKTFSEIYPAADYKGSFTAKAETLRNKKVLPQPCSLRHQENLPVSGSNEEMEGQSTAFFNNPVAPEAEAQFDSIDDFIVVAEEHSDDSDMDSCLEISDDET